MIFAHLPASYILLKSAEAFGYQPTLLESALTLLAGILPDFDLAWSWLFKKNHHDLPTHAPLGIFLVWLVIVAVLGNFLGPIGKWLILLSFFLHLTLDELHNLINCWKKKETFRTEINWLYPLNRFKKKDGGEGLIVFLRSYLREPRANLLLELTICIAALVLFLK